MTLDAVQVRARLIAAYSSLIRHDLHLFEIDANERSITHKLAEYVQLGFPDWNVDCEYNRNGDLPKRLVDEIDRVRTDDTEGETVYPDIIVHKRGRPENLVVIEAKKSSTRGVGNDECKLRSYKSQHHYQFAYAVVFPVRGDACQAAAETDLWEIEG